MSPSEGILFATGQLQRAWLAAVDFRENDVFEFDPAQLTYRVEHEPTVIFGDEEDKPGWAVLRLDASLVWQRTEESDEEFVAPFDLNISVAGLFMYASQVEDRDFAETWLEWNGVYLLWPYLRSYIGTVTGASSFPPLTIYTMQVPDPPPRALEHIERDDASRAEEPDPGSNTKAATKRAGSAAARQRTKSSSRPRKPRQ